MLTDEAVVHALAELDARVDALAGSLGQLRRRLELAQDWRTPDPHARRWVIRFRRFSARRWS